MTAFITYHTMPRYDGDMPWKDLRAHALDKETASHVLHTVAVTHGFRESERNMLANVCRDLGKDHVIVKGKDNTIAVWRTNFTPRYGNDQP